jgi:hypothetical protein
MRVLLAQDIPHVEVRSDSDIVLIGSNGDARKIRAPILISVLGTAMGVNGKRIVGDRVEVRPLRAGLSVAFPQNLTRSNGTRTLGPARISSAAPSGGTDDYATALLALVATLDGKDSRGHVPFGAAA